MYAVIDIGSNTIRLVLYKIENNQIKSLLNKKSPAGLAGYINKDRCLKKSGIRKAIAVLSEFREILDHMTIQEVFPFATASLRNINNAPEVLEAIRENCGFEVRILSGEEEAIFDYYGALQAMEMDKGLLTDIGGGSTELILFKNRKILESVSLPIGAVNTTSMFNTRNVMPANVFSDVSFFIMSRLEKYPWLKQDGLPLIGVGGTARTVAKVIQREKKYPATKIHNYSYTTQTYRSFFNRLRNTNLEQRKKISGLSSERSDIILAGSSIISCLLEATGAKKLITSGCGLREGLFFDYYSKENHVPIIAKDILKMSRENVLNLYEPDQQHSRHITHLVLSMFDGWSELHGLRKNYRCLLETAALLHDIGITINFYSHARHSAYMILNAKLFGLTHKEQVITAAIAGWHNGVSKNYFKDRFYKELLSDANWKTINKLALLLALAESLDYTETSQIHVIEPGINKKTATLKLYAQGIPSIEMHQIQEHLSWFKKTFGVELKVQLATAAEE